MFSREAGADKPVATLVIAYYPDRTPPTCAMNPFPQLSPGPLHITWSCSDERSIARQTELQMREPGRDWGTILTLDAYGNGGRFYDFEEAIGGHTYELRVRATDDAGNVSAWTPDDAAVTTIESTPPLLTITGALDSWLRIGSPLYTPSLFVEDPGPVSSGVRRIEIAYTDRSDNSRYVVDKSTSLPLMPGHRYDFWAQATDRASNASGWIPLGSATAYARSVIGKVTDTRGQTAMGVILRATPAGLNTPVTDEWGWYTAYLGDTNVGQLEVATSGYTAVRALEIPAGQEDNDFRNTPLQIRSLHDRVTNGDFAAPLMPPWQIQGDLAVRESISLGEADYALRLGAPAILRLEGHYINSGDVECVVRGADGSIHLAWISGQGPWDDPRVLYHAVKATGTEAWSTPLALDQARTIALGYHASPGACLLAAGPDGYVGLIYKTGRAGSSGLQFRLRTPAGEWGQPEQLPDDLPVGLVLGPSGTAHVVLLDIYHGNPPATPHLRYYFRSAAGQWTSPVVIAEVDDWDIGARLHVGADGLRQVFWVERDGTGGYCLYATSSRDGNAWTSNQCLVSKTNDPGLTWLDLPVLRQSPSDGLIAMWYQSDVNGAVSVWYARFVNGAWMRPQPLQVPVDLMGLKLAAADVDPQGRWHIALTLPEVTDPMAGALLSGATLETLSQFVVLPLEFLTPSLVSDARDVYILSHMGEDPRYPLAYSPTLHVVRVMHDRSIAPISVSQAITVPADTLFPTLSWRNNLGHLKVGSSGGQLSTELDTADGARHELSTTTETTGSEFTWVDLTPWAGQVIALTFRFDPQGDPTAWAWLDDVHVSGVPLNVGVSVTRSAQQPSAGRPFGFTVTVANRRPYSLTVPVEVTWPADWPLDDVSVVPVSSAAGVTRFELLLDATTQQAITFITVSIPANTPRSAHKMIARLLDPVIAEDYTSGDNRAELPIIVDGLPIWLPVIRK